jgi:O-acetylhomoserine/O-acetylserine sulfhydrylase-like pyridoxal-dependent enzyme
MTYYVPFRQDGKWAISIDLETLTVRAVKGFHPAVTVVEFVAKTLKQAWLAYFRPFEVEGFLKAYK